MKKFSIIVVLALVFFCINIHSGYSQAATAASKKVKTKSVDVNKDGKPDVTYYSTSDGKYVSKAEADTNYDGRPDVIVHTKDGKFASAEADTDYDGKMDKKFTNESQFKKWVNEDRPGFNDQLNRANWDFALLRF